jgi:hypothetical protein
MHHYVDSMWFAARIHVHTCTPVCFPQVFTNSSALTSHDWITIAGYAGQYIFHDIFQGVDRHKQEALDSMLGACLAVLETIAPIADPGSVERLQHLKLRVVEALCVFEKRVPSTEHCIMGHLLSHVPDNLQRFSSVRNTWSFLSERLMGYLKRFVHNRDKAVENVCSALERQRQLLSVPGHVLEDLAQRLHGAGLILPERSLLTTESEKDAVLLSLHCIECVCL